MIQPDAIYGSSGLRAGFADLERLPTVVQINNAGVQRAFRVPWPGSARFSTSSPSFNLLDRVNLIRPASKWIGIFNQPTVRGSTVLNTLTSFGS